MSSENKLLGQAVEVFNAGRFAEAEAMCRSLIAVQPQSGQSCFLLGLILQNSKRLEEALEWLQKAARLEPQAAEIHNALGTVYNSLLNYLQAINCFSTAIEVNPRFADAHYNLAYTWQKLGEYEKSLASYQKTIEINPKDFEAWTHLGKLHRKLNQVDLAIAAHTRAIELAPDFAPAHWNRALALLSAGRLEEGFVEYDWRWRTNFAAFAPRQYAQPVWLGTFVQGKTLLIHAEQGLGDAIQFVRYVRHLRPYVGKIILEAHEPLKSLFERTGYADEVISLGQTPPPFDYFIPLMSLPRFFQTTVGTIPSKVPYLMAPACPNFPACEGKLKVGFAWAENTSKEELSGPSMPLEALSPLFAISGVSFFNLHPPVSKQEDAFLRSQVNWIDLSPQLNDLQHTAALIEQMDLIISVDSPIAHLAGALGKPTWTLLPSVPDWRWMLTRLDSPWYPTMRLFRQPQSCDWSPVMENVTAELRKIA